MVRKTNVQNYKTIYRILLDNPLTKYQISKKTKINWETANNIVNILIELGFVKIHKEKGTKKLYIAEENAMLWRKCCEVYLQKIERMRIRNEELRKALIDCELSKYHCRVCAGSSTKIEKVTK